LVYLKLQEISFDKGSQSEKPSKDFSHDAETVFKRISVKTKAESLKATKVKQNEVRDFLQHRYSSRLASKLLAMFDWSLTSLDF